MISKENLKSFVQTLINSHPNSWHRILKSYSCKDIMDALDFYFPQLNSPEYKPMTKVYWLFNDLKEFPKCGNARCSNTFEHRNVISLECGYRKNCCPQCAKDSDERKHLYVESCKRNYSVDNISQYECTKQKKEEKALAKYGVKNVSQAPKVKATTAATNKELYGATTYLHSKEGEEHKKRSCLEKYGVDSFSKTSMHTEMMKAKNQENYGVDWPQQSHEFMKTVLRKYTYNGINFDSAIEIAIYIWCKDNSIDFEYQPRVAFNYEFDGNKHTYEPDFLIEGKLIEVKGDHFFKEDGTMQNPFDHTQDGLYEAKHQCMLHNNVTIWKHVDYAKYIEYVNEKYGKGYLKQFKNK